VGVAGVVIVAPISIVISSDPTSCITYVKTSLGAVYNLVDANDVSLVCSLYQQYVGRVVVGHVWRPVWQNRLIAAMTIEDLALGGQDSGIQRIGIEQEHVDPRTAI